MLPIVNNVVLHFVNKFVNNVVLHFVNKFVNNVEMHFVNNFVNNVVLHFVNNFVNNVLLHFVDNMCCLFLLKISVLQPAVPFHLKMTALVDNLVNFAFNYTFLKLYHAVVFYSRKLRQ